MIAESIRTYTRIDTKNTVHLNHSTVPLQSERVDYVCGEVAQTKELFASAKRLVKLVVSNCGRLEEVLERVEKVAVVAADPPRRVHELILVELAALQCIRQNIDIISKRVRLFDKIRVF